MSRHTPPRSRHPHTRPSNATWLVPLLWLTATQACTFDTASLDELTCSEEGQAQGERVCRDGYWIVTEPGTVDMPRTMRDMDGQDLAIPDQDLPGRDMDPPDQDMTIPPPEDMDFDLTTTPDMPADMPADMPDMPGVECPTEPALLCEMFRDDRNNNKACADLMDQALTLTNGCVLPRGTRCDCLQDNEVCTITNLAEDTGSCAPPECVPESDDDYCARVQSASMNTRVCGKGFPTQDNCGQRRPEVSCDFCNADEACQDPSVPSQCACVPLDPVADFAALCQQNGAPCGALTLPDGCGGQITIEDCTTCSDAETCTPAPNPQANQAVATCEPLPVQRLSPPPNLGTNARFGAALATDGTWLAVGAPTEEVVNSDGTTVRCGAVHMYQLEQGTWVWKQRVADARGGICNSGTEEFGFAVDVKGTRLVVGAPGDGNAGRVHLFTYFNNQWTRRATFGPDQDISPANNQYSNDARIGHDVAVHDVGQGRYRVGIGAPLTNFDMGRSNAGLVYIIDASFQNNAWSYDWDLVGSQSIQSNASLGTSMTWRDATRLWSGSPYYSRQNDTNTGAIDEFIYNTASDTASSNGGPYDINGLGLAGQSNSDDAFYAYAMASDEATNWIVVGAPGKNNDQGMTYVMDSNFAVSHQALAAPSTDNDDSFGITVDICSNERLIVGAPGDDGPGNTSADTGAAFVYELTNTGFSLMYEARIPALPSGSRAGEAVAIHPDWGFFSASRRQSGEVYVINLNAVP